MTSVLVEVVRGTEVESVHRGHAVVVDAGGRIVACWGDADRRTYPRSAAKPLQALPLIESGAAHGLGDAQIALACASHGGEPGHVARVAGWLARLGLDESSLECGAHWPSDAAAARALAAAGRQPTPLYNNCSGKHTGFLATAWHLGEPTAGYIQPDHPVQRRVTATLAEMCGCDVAAAPCGVDGCGIPTFALPLAGLALGMARLADPSGLAPQRREAAQRIRDAMAAEPWLVAGTGQLCTEVIAAAPQVLVKGGAEGVHAVALPALGLGVAVKIDDGARRAAEMAVMAVLERLGAFDETQRTRLTKWLRPPVLNVAGRQVGEIRARLEE